MPERTMPADQAARDAIIHERERNVAVIAGAGTGKTQTIIARAVELLAPRQAEVQPLPIQRMALITFTRRAAGELRYRIREQLLRELEQAARHHDHTLRAQRLRDALGNLDAAFVGTIHGFADRLLRLRPVEAKLSPAYVLLDDTSDLVRETFWRLRRAAESSGLRTELGRFAVAVRDDLIDEAADTLRAAARAGLQMQRGDGPFGPLASLESIVARMIETRDVDVDMQSLPDPGIAEVHAAAQQFAQRVASLRGTENGPRQLRRTVRHLSRLAHIDDPAEIVRVVSEALPRRGLFKGRDFDNHPLGWGLWKDIDPDNGSRAYTLDKLKGPHRWLASRFVRLFPVVNALYENVKAERGVVDYLDLLLKLRNLLRDPEAREFYQGLFDHLFVDEFQDTDPLQCEIVFYLCEQGAAAETWEKARLAPGKLTIVGDPKQSIYRFRRADIAMYGVAMDRLQANGALVEHLDTNFRSRPELIEFFNRQLLSVLGKSGSEAFDPVSGRANYEDLSPTSNIPAGGITVHRLPYADSADEGLLATDGRVVEAAMLARYVRWLLASGHMVRDSDSGGERPLQLGDIAVLANVTTNLPLLLRAFDRLGIEYTARGGALFLGHPVIRQYLLALRSLADADDGIAEAALLAPPFFALDLADQVATVANFKNNNSSDGTMRVGEARDIIRQLRARRHTQAPGATARDLIERTALGMSIASDRNGKQTLAALYEVAAEIDRRAAMDGLDFDAVTETVRRWAADPVYIDAPEPTDSRVLRVMTIHSAKGLEFPVVILWDGFQVLNDRSAPGWLVDRRGQAWALGLGQIAVEYPRGGALSDRERQFGEQECRRKYYVAATRARDLLVLPLPLTKSKTLAYATTVLGGSYNGDTAQTFETYRTASPPAWAQVPAPALSIEIREVPDVRDDAASERHGEGVRAEFATALAQATQPFAVPVAVTAAAGNWRSQGDTASASELAHKVTNARFGTTFGSTVHRALELRLVRPEFDTPTALRLAVIETALTQDLAAAADDVDRAMEALRREALDAAADREIATEYPITGQWRDGQLLAGFIDLLVVTSDTVSVIDFKTDSVVAGNLATAYPAYHRQLKLYGEMLRNADIVGPRQLRLGLLFTATGELRWNSAS